MAIKSRVEGTERKYTYQEWLAEGRRRFGGDILQWRFGCPSCGHVTTVEAWKKAGAPEGAVAYSCVGRYLPPPVKDAFANDGGPCNYAGGGLFRINPVTVIQDGQEDAHVFDFAEAPV